MIKERLLEILKKHEREVGISRKDYLSLLKYTAKELDYECDIGHIIEWFGMDSKYVIRLKKVEIPVKRTFSFIPNGKLKIKLKIPFSYINYEDKIKVPYFVDEQDALSKLNNFLRKATECKNKYFPVFKSQSEHQL